MDPLETSSYVREDKRERVGLLVWFVEKLDASRLGAGLSVRVVCRLDGEVLAQASCPKLVG